jgi:hypothetical protein
LITPYRSSSPGIVTSICFLSTFPAGNFGMFSSWG